MRALQHHVLAIDQKCRWALIEWRETGLSSSCSWGLGLYRWIGLFIGECRWHTQANFSGLWSSSRHEIGLTTLLTCPSFSNMCNTYFPVTLLTCFLLPLGVWVPNTVLSQDQADLPKLPNKKHQYQIQAWQCYFHPQDCSSLMKVAFILNVVEKTCFLKMSNLSDF